MKVNSWHWRRTVAGEQTNPENFLSRAAPEPPPQPPRTRKRLSKTPAILVCGAAFGLPMVRHCSHRFWILEKRLPTTSLHRLVLQAFNPKSKSGPADENPKCYLMTRSARASTLGGIVRPICLAVLRLINSSNFVGCSTGRSAGFAPFRILST